MASVKKSKMLSIRLSDEAFDYFRKLCKQRRVSPSEAVRRLIREASELGPTLDGESRDEVRRLTAELKAVGVNLNQIARAMNAGLLLDAGSLAECVDILRETLPIYDKLFSAICAPRYGRAIRSVEAPEP